MVPMMRIESCLDLRESCPHESWLESSFSVWVSTLTWWSYLLRRNWSSSDIYWKDATFFLQLNDVQVLKFYSTLWKLFCRLFSGENPFRDKRRLLQSVTEHSSTEIHPPNTLVSKTDKKFVPGLISDYWTKYCWK